MVFETTAIPGYANSAETKQIKACFNPDPSIMQIIIEVEGAASRVIESMVPISIGDVIQQLGYPVTTTLLVHEGQILPHSAIIQNDVRLTAIDVASGG